MNDSPRFFMTRRIFNPFVRYFLVAYFLLLPGACTPPTEFSSEPLPASKIFSAEGIKNEKIQFVWLELPLPFEPGVAEARLFLAKSEPPEPTIPNPNPLRCLLSSDNEKAILGPERVPFEFAADGTFIGTYTYRACPECIECYMNWDYTLEMSGELLEETLTLDIVIKHFGLNVQGSYLSAELGLVEDPNKEPRITCNHSIECKKIVYTSRR